MAKVMGIHGIGQQYRAGEALKEVWLPNLRGGLSAAGRADLSRSLTDGDFQVAFFGGLFRRRYGLGVDENFGATDPDDLTSEAEQELVAALYDEACELEEDLGEPVGALGLGTAAKKLGAYPPVGTMCERLLRSQAFAGLIPERAFAGNLKQVIKFLRDDDVKDRVFENVDEMVDDDTTVVIGHSLGSVVAYEYLCRFRPSGVRLLVTLGCPLGIRNVVFDRLTPKPVDGSGSWPGPGSMSWVNVADPRDIVAMRKDLSPLFPAPDGGDGGIADRLVDNGDTPHAIEPYLTAQETGSAIAAALSG